MGKEFSFHKICLSAIFIFGNVALFVPYKNAKSGELSAVLIAITASVIAYFLWYFIADRIYSSNKNSIIIKGVLVILIIACLVANTITAKNFINYISSEVLIKNSKLLITAAFAAVCIYLTSKTNETLAKLSFISFFFVIITIVILFAVSFQNFEAVPSKQLFCGKVFKRSLLYFSKVFLFPFVFAVFSRFAYIKKSPKNDVLGLIIGSALIIICFVSAVLTFGLVFASKTEFAYAISISVVNVGELYTRMDGFAYFIFFLCALIKTSVCAATVKMLLNATDSKKTFKTTAFLMIGSFAVSYLI